jgi:hypothetical protein
MNIRNRLRQLIFESEGDFGYHAGNLAHKSGTLSRNNYQKTLRSQLGTGYYFFGDLNDALELAGVKKGDKNRADMLKGTTVYSADFSKYKLFKPRNASEFYDNLIIPTIKFLNLLTSADLKDKENIEGLLDVADYYRELGVNITDKRFMQIVKKYLNDNKKFSKSRDTSSSYYKDNNSMSKMNNKNDNTSNENKRKERSKPVKDHDASDLKDLTVSGRNWKQSGVHPSWAAKQINKSQQPAIVESKGKKTVFED